MYVYKCNICMQMTLSTGVFLIWLQCPRAVKWSWPTDDSGDKGAQLRWKPDQGPQFGP